MKFKLYHCPGTRSARVKWLLHELIDDAFEVEIVALREAVQYRPGFLSKNPNHAVPVLEITSQNGSSMHMIESGAMIALLADSFPEKRLAPCPDHLSSQRADYLQMLHFGASWMDMILWQIRIHEHLLPRSDRDPITVRRYRGKFANEIEPQLRARLATTRHICGDTFSAADCVIGQNVRWARAYRLCLDDVFTQYLSRLSERPAYVRAFSDVTGGPAVPEDSPVVALFTG
ncbi:MAG TPA: glutathione S-transferase family protein [Xanthobacteraceae bacterium]|jgi:glutathione S-transferase|nr:glutathione S-transferase family protein [Xanthobacteraceae bacterium]